VSHSEGVGRAPSASEHFTSRAHPKIKGWPSGMDIGHEADNLILENIIMLGSPTSVYGEYFNVVLRWRNMGG